MALLNRFSKLNDRGETGIFTFIVTKSVTRDFHRDATTKDFCFGYHRWAISFQRPTEKVLGVHLLLRNPSPSTACIVDFSLALLNRQHFSQNEVYTKRQAKFTITNPMQGVSRWIQMSDLIDRHFSNETGEFLFELSLSDMITIFECDIQLNANLLTQYKTMLKNGPAISSSSATASVDQLATGKQQEQASSSAKNRQTGSRSGSGSELINLETNYFTFGSFDWSLTIVPLVIPSQQQQHGEPQPAQQQLQSSSTSSSSSNNNLLTTATPVKQQAKRGSLNSNIVQQQHPEPVCRVYLNRLNGFDCLCRVKYKVILGHHSAGQSSGQQHSSSAEFVDSKVLDQISDNGGRIRGHQFRDTNILKLISLKSGSQSSNGAQSHHPPASGSSKHHSSSGHSGQQSSSGNSSLDLRVHIEMFCANTISEAKVPVSRKPNEPQVSNCCDRNKQAWCVESDTSESEHVRLKLFFLDLQSVPRNHIRYISWTAYLVKRDSKSNLIKESLPAKNSPHSNYYLQDGIDMGTIMDTELPVRDLNNSTFLDANQLTVHIEWIDSLLLFSHLYNNYDALATIQRHQISRELDALQYECAHLEKKYIQARRSLNQIMAATGGEKGAGQAKAKHKTVTLSDPENDNHRQSAITGDEEEDEGEDDDLDDVVGLEEAEDDDLADYSLESPCDSIDQFGAGQRYSGPAKVKQPAIHHQLSQNHEPQLAQAAQGASLANQMSAPLSISGYQQQPKTPMSLDERMKFSSSTPPSLLNQPKPLMMNAANLVGPPTGALSAIQANQSTQRQRRQLPQQPTTPKLAKFEQLRRDSYQHQFTPDPSQFHPISRQAHNNMGLPQPLTPIPGQPELLNANRFTLPAPHHHHHQQQQLHHPQQNQQEYYHIPQFEQSSAYSNVGGSAPSFHLQPAAQDKILVEQQRIDLELESMYLTDPSTVPLHHRKSEPLPATASTSQAVARFNYSFSQQQAQRQQYQHRYHEDARRDSSEHIMKQQPLLLQQTSRPSLNDIEQVQLVAQQRRSTTSSAATPFPNVDQYNSNYGRLI